MQRACYKKLKLSTQSPLKLNATTKDNIEIESEEIISTTCDGGQTLSKKVCISKYYLYH